MKTNDVEEVWKDIPGYEGCYQASNLGKIRSLDRFIRHSEGHLSFRKGKILKFYKDSDEYLRVSLSKEGDCRDKSVHRLILLTFVGPSSFEANHKNGDKTDNSLYNLEYILHRKNIQHARASGLYKKSERTLLTSEKCEEIENKYSSGNYSQVALAKEYNICRSSVKRILKG